MIRCRFKCSTRCGRLSVHLSAACTAARFAGASPSVELQSMGSVLGDDGQWLFAELSTGAIGALSPKAPMVQQVSQDTQLQQHQAVAGPGPHSSAADAAAQQQPTTSMAMAPAPVSRALPASSGMAPSCSLPIMPGAAGAFGFGAAPAGAAAAAAAARLCLFDGSFGASPQAPSISPAAQHSRGLTASMPPPAGPQVADSIGRYSSSGGGGGNRGLSAPLPHLLPGRGSMCGTAGSDGLMRLDSLQQPYRPSLHGEHPSALRTNVNVPCWLLNALQDRLQLHACFSFVSFSASSGSIETCSKLRA